MTTRIVYVLTLKTWEEYDRAHHWYGRIHWTDAASNFHSDDSQTEPDADDISTCRHPSKESCVAGARRWFDAHRRPGDVLLIGVWGLDGWQDDCPVEVLEGSL